MACDKVHGFRRPTWTAVFGEDPETGKFIDSSKQAFPTVTLQGKVVKKIEWLENETSSIWTRFSTMNFVATRELKSDRENYIPELCLFLFALVFYGTRGLLETPPQYI